MSVAICVLAAVALSFVAYAIGLFCFLVGASIDLIMMLADLFNFFMDGVSDFFVVLKRRTAG